MRSRNLSTTVIVLVIVAMCFLIHELLPWRFGLSGFEGRHFGGAYQLIFLALLATSALLWLNIGQRRSILYSSIWGGVLGFVCSATAFAVSNMLFARSIGMSENIRVGVEALVQAPMSYIIGILVASAAALGWLYGLVLFAIGQLGLRRIDNQFTREGAGT